MSSSETLQCVDAALEYARRGFRVLPICPVRGCRSRTCKPGKHPMVGKWQECACSDPTQIRQWFSKWPDAGVGIATGTESKVFVVDVDGQQGEETLLSLMKTHDWNPNTLTATTGRGRHLYFCHPGGKVITRAAIAPGLDVRGDGGLVVAPPSPHVTGAHYQWVDADKPIADAPAWLAKMVTESKVKAAVSFQAQHTSAEDVVIQEGERNAKLLSIAGKLRAAGMGKNEIETQLMSLNNHACKPPLADEEVRGIAHSISKYPPRKSKASLATRRAEGNCLPYFPLYVNEWLADRDLLFMDAEQRGWYLCLVLESWKGAGTLENDTDKLWKLARASSKKTFERKQDAVLSKFEEVTDEDRRPILVNRVMEELWRVQHETWQKKVAAGNASAKRSKQRNEANAEGNPLEPAQAA